MSFQRENKITCFKGRVNLVASLAIVFAVLVLAETDPLVAADASLGQLCAKYEGKWVSYYHEIYKIKNCKKFLVVDQDQVARHVANEGIIKEVKADIINKLPSGSASKSVGSTHKRGCKELEGHYVTHTLNEVYLVEKCKKRLFIDWESFVLHSSKKGIEARKIIELTWQEFTPIDDGQNMKSETDEMFKRELNHSPIDIISVRTACKGIEGKIVAFYQDVYRIENCKKRQLLDHSKIGQLAETKLVELSSQQWLSLPVGKPILAPVNKQEQKEETEQ